ncbi:MAG TPA: hypothetical protein VK177_20080 [Flavobacteriales bacterium]|nr:hypothetical protein [Flavobacteriales bacterium]
MCESSHTLKFCTCTTVDESDMTITYVWELRSLVNSGNPVLGKFVNPSFELDDVVNEKKLVDALNRKNCFDFDYQPRENDQLQIRYNKNLHKPQFISFIFKGGKWKWGQWVHAVNRETQEISNGFVKPVTP